MRALWAEAESAIRTDPQYAIDMAEEVHRLIEFERDSAARSERARQASALGVAARAALKAERDAAEG